MDPKKKVNLFKTNKNFCVVPWTNFEIFTNGDIKTCSAGKETFGNVNETDIMEILTKNPTLKRIKTNMLNDRPDSNCVECQHRSINEENFSYLRDHYNSKIIKEDIDYENIENFDMRFIDLHWSNICNLKCIMCDADQSSLIAKAENVFISPVKKENIEKINQMVIKNQTLIKEIYMSGGEPFYIPYNHVLLKQISNKDIPIRINTNMHWKPNNKLFQILKTFNDVQLTMSADALYDKFNYIRNGSNWDTFIENLQFVKQNTNFGIRVNMIFSVINAIDMCNVIKFFYFGEQIQDITINTLYSPKEIDSRNYPINKKKKIVNDIKELLNTISSKHTNLRSNLKNCINQIQLDNEYEYNDCLDSITKRHTKKWQLVFEDLV
jgi:radical SAM protein with 4Fe4S-binding SPASM domain